MSNSVGKVSAPPVVRDILNLASPPREENAAARLAFDKIRQGLCVFGRDHRLLFFNRRYAEMYGLAPVDLAIGMSLREIIDRRHAAGTGPNMSPDAYAAWRERINCGTEIVESTVTLHNGCIHEIHHEPLPSGGWVATFDDITERVHARTRLAESEARYRTLADALPQMVWVTRASDGEAIYWNEPFVAYFGEIATDRAARVARCHPDDLACLQREMERCRSHGCGFALDVRLRRHDGVHRWHKLVVNPVRQDGEVVEHLGTALDIDDLVTAHEALRSTSDRLRLAQEAAGAGLFDWSLDQGCARLSPESLRLFNLPDDHPAEITAAQWSAAVHPEDLPVVMREAERVVATNSTYRAEFRVPLPSGNERWVQAIGSVVHDERGRAVRIAGLNLDATERRRGEEALRASATALRTSEERLALALDGGSDGLWDWDVATGATWFSERWQTMLGYGADELEGHVRTWERLVHPDDKPEAARRLSEHFAGHTVAYECEHRLRCKDGSWAWILARGKVVARGAAGVPLRIVGTHIDLTARKQAEARISHMARHDALTDLPNRTLFRERLEQRLAEVRRQGGQAALLCLDLDQFKTINDTLGHAAGDALLREVGQRIRAVLRVEDTPARLGGDEFAILLGGSEHLGTAASLAERLVEAVREPVHLGEQQVGVGVSIGIALAPDHGLDADALLKRADLALYRAKHEGRNTYRFFEPAMDEAMEARRRLELDLRLALRRGEFTLHYQPIVEAASGSVVAYEALVRWFHPVRGLVSPSEFIPLAEETGLIVPLGEWVLRAATHDICRFPSQARVAVNVSAVQMRHASLTQTVQAALRASGLAAGRLELEITESVLLDGGERVHDVLSNLRDLGVHVALDDFGTGYSSLSYLRRFPFDRIKIDRTFIAGLDDPGTAAIVQAIIDLGIRLGMAVTAEGIETAEQLAAVRAMGCTQAQGYLLGRPQPLAATFAGLSRMVESSTGREPDLGMRRA